MRRERNVLLAVPAAGAQTRGAAGGGLGPALLALAAATSIELGSVIAAAIEGLALAPGVARVSRIAGAHGARVLDACVIARAGGLPAAVTGTRRRAHARCRQTGTADALLCPRNRTIAIGAVTDDGATVERHLTAHPATIALAGRRTRVFCGRRAIAPGALQVGVVVLPRLAFARDGRTRLGAFEVLRALFVVVNAARVRTTTSLFEGRLLAGAVLHAPGAPDEVSALALNDFK